jgi:predicted metallo-beta-lactamase superfamily hydrolase
MTDEVIQQAERLTWLTEQYPDALEAWTETNNALKQAEKNHSESKETLKALKDEITELMASLSLDHAKFKDLNFHYQLKEVNVVDEDAAREAIKAQGLADEFIKVTMAGLKKHSLSQFIGIEHHPALVVKAD